jgi:hypothetical protein
MATPRTPAWRLSLLWQETVLDTVTVTSARRSLALRTGDVVDVVVADGHLEVRGDRLEAILQPGQRLILPAGHVLLAEPDVPNPVAVGALSVDSTLLHAGMIAVAMTICAFSALWLHPTSGPADPGGGLRSDNRRWLSLPGGSAGVVGRPVFQATGRTLDLGERFELRPTPGAAAPTPAAPRETLEATLAEMARALRPDGQGGEQKDPLGEAVRQVAAAPVLGAGVGGLSPRDPVDTGRGAGVIGAGDSQRLEALRRQQVRDDARALPARTIYPVQLADVPDAAVTAGGRIDATPELDPMVREHLSRMIRTRHNVVRACYEAWGLAANASRKGRLVLELTLRPDGRVEAVHTEGSDPGLERVGACVVRAASDWYLGDGLVEEPTRLAFPFNLQPRLTSR